MWNRNGLSIADRSLSGGRCRTTVTVAGNAVDGYALPLETLNDLAHPLSRMFRGMIGYPRIDVKSSLKWGPYERE
jgi:hypothetical protein